MGDVGLILVEVYDFGDTLAEDDSGMKNGIMQRNQECREGSMVG